MFTKKSQDKFKQYQDPTREFTNRTLQLGKWYVEHKILLRKIFVISLIIWNVITISIGLFVWGKYLIIDMVRDDQNIASIANSYISQIAIQNQGPQQLNITQVRTFGSAPDRYDFVASVRNANAQWAAQITYHFSYSGGQTKDYTIVLLPGQERVATALGHELPRVPSGTNFFIVDTQWKRLNPHLLSDPAVYISQRLNFEVSNLDFKPANKSQGTGTNIISFDVYNNSLYGYWSADFIVKFMNQGQMTGLAPLTISQFKSGETRNIALTSLADILSVDTVELEPIINVFDSSVYMPLSSNNL